MLATGTFPCARVCAQKQVLVHKHVHIHISATAFLEKGCSPTHLQRENRRSAQGCGTATPCSTAPASEAPTSPCRSHRSLACRHMVLQQTAASPPGLQPPLEQKAGPPLPLHCSMCYPRRGQCPQSLGCNDRILKGCSRQHQDLKLFCSVIDITTLLQT